MPETQPSSNQFEIIKQEALSNPEAARRLALAGTVILSTQLGYGLLAARAQRDLARVKEMGQEIGASNAADPDWLENAELQNLKSTLPIYADIYAESVRDLGKTIVYAEEIGGTITFGSELEAVILYPDRDTTTIRALVLLGPNEKAYGDLRYIDPNTGKSFTVISYLSEIGKALWGAKLSALTQAPLTFSLPNNQGEAKILQVTLKGKAS